MGDVLICPNCGEEIQDKFNICPYCAFSLTTFKEKYLNAAAKKREAESNSIVQGEEVYYEEVVPPSEPSVEEEPEADAYYEENNGTQTKIEVPPSHKPFKPQEIPFVKPPIKPKISLDRLKPALNIKDLKPVHDSEKKMPAFVPPMEDNEPDPVFSQIPPSPARRKLSIDEDVIEGKAEAASPSQSEDGFVPIDITKNIRADQSAERKESPTQKGSKEPYQANHDGYYDDVLPEILDDIRSHTAENVLKAISAVGALLLIIWYLIYFL